MIRFNVKGIPAAQNKMRRVKRQFDQRFRQKVFLTAQYVHISLTSLTAVWMGTSLANWQWSTGRAASGVLTARGGRREPGKTNSMSLGAEPRRDVNQKMADASFRRLSFKDPYLKFVLANNDPKIGQMDAGKLPRPGMSRTQDMVRITRVGVLDYIKTIKV